MNHPRILLQLDTDANASTFDAIVALDSGVDQLLQYSSVDEQNVTGLVHGAMFTRGPGHLQQTAIFIGGTQIEAGEQLAAKIQATFFGPVRVSTMLDSSGANTTASAAVLCAARHVSLEDCTAMVLGGTGAVGGRVVRLLLNQGSQVHLVSRAFDKAKQACLAIREQVNAPHSNHLSPLGMEDERGFTDRLKEANVVFACGAAGARLLSQQQLDSAGSLKVAIDLNAVPPEGIEGIGSMDKAVPRDNRIDYGAIGVGGLKMKIHRAAIHSLFTRNDQALDVNEIFAIGKQLEA